MGWELVLMDQPAEDLRRRYSARRLGGEWFGCEAGRPGGRNRAPMWSIRCTENEPRVPVLEFW